ncbi:hypothetical protein EDC01DRAFT_728250 [Geopyxis carbonaria]|nr:hypothetical protein EDC01DRAFT_728250 [Geopyxis carbonaria]
MTGRSSARVRKDDSRPKQLEIRGRKSDVRSLIDFFNTKAFSGTSTPRSSYLREQIPANKVKSLVTNFNRIESFSVSATVFSGYTSIRSSRPTSKPILNEKGRARGENMKRAPSGKSNNAPKSFKVPNGVEEITVSGGDNREMSITKSKEPFRSVKVWKDFEAMTRSTDQVDEVIDDDSSTLDERGKIPEHNTVKKKKKKYRNLDSSARPTKATPEIDRDRDRRTPDSFKRVHHWELQTPLANTHKNQSSPPESRRSKPRRKKESKETTDYNNPDRDKNKIFIKNQSSVDEQLEPSIKHSFAGSIRGTFRSVFGKNEKPSKEGSTKEVHLKKSSLDTYGIEDGLPIYPIHVPGIDGGQTTRSPEDTPKLNTKSSLVGPVHKSGVRFSSDRPVILTTEATPIDQTQSPIGALLGDDRDEQSETEDLIPEQKDGRKSSANLTRKPRTFKEIAQERRQQRIKSEQAILYDEHLSVPPLRVEKGKDEIHQKDLEGVFRPPEPGRLREMASRETLVSFEDPHLPNSSSSSLVSEHQNQETLNIPEAPSTQSMKDTHIVPGRDTPAIKGLKKNELVTRTPSGELRTYTPLRSPSLMREMAPPKLNIRKKPIVEKKPPKKLVPRYTPTSMEHYVPRMKLRGDDDWMRVSQRRKSQIDGWRSSVESVELPQTKESSTSHDTTASSQISQTAVTGSKVYQKQTQNLDLSSSILGELGDDTGQYRDSKDVPPQNVKLKRRESKVGFTSTTQNFLAVQYSDDEMGRMQERGTILDGATTTGLVTPAENTSHRIGSSRRRNEEKRWTQERGRVKRRGHRD